MLNFSREVESLVHISFSIILLKTDSNDIGL